MRHCLRCNKTKGDEQFFRSKQMIFCRQCYREIFGRSNLKRTDVTAESLVGLSRQIEDQMRHSEVDKRAKRTAPKQCVSDYGMHRDAKRAKGTVVRFIPLKDELAELKRRLERDK